MRIPRKAAPARRRPERIAADKGYSFERTREWLRRYRIGAVIPQRSDQLARHRGRPLTFDGEAYRRQNVIEPCVRWLKEHRAVGTRFDRPAVNFLATVKVAIIARYLRKFELPDSA